VVVALRGHLTRNRWINLRNEVALGDPGLLMDWVYPQIRTTTKKRYKVGLLPHYIDFQNMGLREFLRKNKDATGINICARVPDVLAAIAECEFILSSSLHGLVFADSLQIPNAWMTLSSGIVGGSFKFRDYYSVFNILDPLPCQFNQEMSVDDLWQYVRNYHRPNLESIQQGLFTSFPARDLSERFVDEVERVEEVQSQVEDL
jgi:pyruvyltransferase